MVKEAASERDRQTLRKEGTQTQTHSRFIYVAEDQRANIINCVKAAGLFVKTEVTAMFLTSYIAESVS